MEIYLGVAQDQINRVPNETRESLLVKLANHLTTQGDLSVNNDPYKTIQCTKIFGYNIFVE